MTPNEANTAGSERSILGWVLLAGAFIIITLTWGLSPYLVKYWANEDTWSKTADFGNTFGAINSLFAGLAFGSLIAAILLQNRDLSLQRQELMLQREELALTRRVLDEQRQQLESQALSLKRQTFETTFLQLLKVVREIEDTAFYKSAGVAYTGAQAIRNILDSLRSTLGTCEVAVLQEKYIQWARNRQGWLDCYMGTISEILEFVDKSQLDQKVVYFRLLRTLLATGGLEILFYYELTSRGRPEIKSLIEKYGMFAYLPDRIPQEHRALYEPSAFEDRLVY